MKKTDFCLPKSAACFMMPCGEGTLRLPLARIQSKNLKTDLRMPNAQPLSVTALAIKKWRGKRGALIMALHEIQNQQGFVPREAALEISAALAVPLARIYEVLTFYNYFKLDAPGKAVISVCTGTACHLKGAPALVEEFKRELGLEVGQTDASGDFHLQCVRCVGCCGLAPVAVINGKTYGKLQPSEIRKVVAEWRERLARGEIGLGTGETEHGDE